MAVWLAYHTGHVAPENSPWAIMFAAPDPIVSLADELRPLCAGGLPDLATIATVKLFDTPSADFQRVLNINLNGVVYGCRAFGPRMDSGRAGSRTDRGSKNSSSTGRSPETAAARLMPSTLMREPR